MPNDADPNEAGKVEDENMGDSLDIKEDGKDGDEDSNGVVGDEEEGRKKVIMRQRQTLKMMVRTLTNERSKWSHQNPRSSPADSSLSLLPLHDLDFESMSISFHLSVSSFDPENHPQISLNSNKLAIQISLNSKKLVT